MPSCYAFGCANNSKKESCKDVKFFRIPASQREQERRRLWLAAIRRKGEPYADAKICSAHFVSGHPAKWWDKKHPDYVPSVFNFPTSHQVLGDPKKNLDRYHRAQKISQRHSAGIHEPATPSEAVGDMSCCLDDDICNLIDIVPDDEKTPEPPQSTPTTGICIATVQDASTNTDGGHYATMEDVSRLRVIVDMFRDSNERLSKENAALKAENQELRRASRPDVFDSLREDEEKLKFYTGLPSLASFLFLLQLLVLSGFEKFRSLSLETTLLALLLKLKLGLTNKDIAYRLNVNVMYVGTIISTRLPFLASVARRFMVWPTKEAVRANLPPCFRLAGRELRKTRVVVDCFELFTERPKSLVARAKLWSNYKSHSTVKFLIGISPAGAVTFLSKAWGGRASDKAITLDSELMDLVEPYDVVLADRGFLVRDEMAALNVTVLTPHFTHGKKQMSRKEVQESRRISRVRIHVERVIGRLRRNFRILNGVLPMNLAPQIDNIVVSCCGILNMHKGVV